MMLDQGAQFINQIVFVLCNISFAVGDGRDAINCVEQELPFKRRYLFPPFTNSNILVYNF